MPSNKKASTNRGMAMNRVRLDTVRRTKGVALVLTAFVIGLLVIAGPVQGFNLGLSMDDNSVDKGEEVVFNVELVIESGEGLPVEYLILELNGPEYSECKFNLDGSIISECKGVKSIVDTKQVSYGYGYGYGNYNNYAYYFGHGYGYGYGLNSGKLSYEITLDTSNYKTGTYNTEFIAKIGGENFSKTGQDLKINYVSDEDDGENKKSKGYGTCAGTWVCSEWSECIDGVQSRNCEKVKPYCYGIEQPIEVRACNVIYLGESNEGGTNPAINLGDEGGGDNREGSESSNRITGAAVSNSGIQKLSKTLGTIAIFLAILVVVLMGIIMLRRVGKRK
jgi:hypothetical protein